MLYFECDYNNGCTEEILKALSDTNSTFTPGYGRDEFSISAIDKIRDATGCNMADVYFLCGGTQTNATVIASILRNCEGVICATTGHIALHEAGAIENTGHKVLTIPSHDGKIDAKELKAYIDAFYADSSYDHMVFPGMVYISFPTEYGTIYSKKELTDIHNVCKEYNLPLYIDGARLAYGLASDECDVTFKEFSNLCDVFYIGGTKVGALCGEAVVFPHGDTAHRFYTFTKTMGAMFAKGRLVGIQFDALFTDNLYFNLGRHGCECAKKMNEILEKHGFKFYLKTPTNQQFVYMSDDRLKSLDDKLRVSVWEKLPDGNNIVRFCSSWATSDNNLADLDALLP